MSMVLLISSRIIFTFGDVSESGKQVVSIVLIIFLAMNVIYTLGQILHQKFSPKPQILITPGMVESLRSQDRLDVAEVFLEHQVVFRKRVVQIDPDFASNSKAASILLSQISETRAPQSKGKVLGLCGNILSFLKNLCC
jgi:hypothetical protein